MITASSRAISQLSAAERIQLVQDIWDSIAASPEAVGLSEAQAQALDRRMAAYREDPQKGRSWQEVQQRAWE